VTTPPGIPVLTGDAAAAAAHRGGHVQIIAGAGSGKTETVSQRVAGLVAEGVEPSRIVAFTFTKLAAEELKSRIRERTEHFAGPAAADRLGAMFVGTINGFCFQLLTRHVTRYENYGVLDENQAAAFMQRYSHQLKVKELAPQGTLFKGLGLFATAVDIVENEMLDVDLLPERLRDALTTYYELLDSHRLLSYGRQIGAAIEALHDPEHHATITAAIDHLIVDEYQDINPAQEELIRLLAAPVGRAHLVVVGDDDQAIYQWRGSTVENIVTFRDRYPGAAAFELLANRRSRPAIVALANRFAATIPDRIDKTMEAVRDANGPAVDIIPDLPLEKDEASEIAMTIARLRASGFAYSDMAILVRGKVAYPAILTALEERGIPVQPGDRRGLFEQPDADFLGRCIAWLPGYAWRTGRYTREQEEVTIESLRSIATALYELRPADWRRVETALTSFRAKSSMDSRQVSLVDEMYALIEALGVAAWDTGDPVRASRLGTIARVVKFVADYEGMQRRARVEGDGQVGAGNQADFYFKNLAALMLNVALGDYSDFGGEEDLLTDSVRLMTVHGAKGLEWPIVFLPSLTSKRFPSGKAGREAYGLVPRDLYDAARYEGGDADERRLFYVALTRAREWVSLSAHAAVNKQQVHPSDYIIESQRFHEEERDTPRPPGAPASASDGDLAISYSDLAAFLACGHSYHLRTLLGFPPAIAEQLGYGNAVHHIMRVIGEESTRLGRLLRDREIERLIATDFYLPFANKKIAETFKEQARKLVDTYLTKHRDDMLRVWETERPFELALPGAVISGRADVILDRSDGREERLAIVDYKTEVDADDPGLQLQVYTVAARREGLTVEGAYIHDLGRADRRAVDTSDGALDAAIETVVGAVNDIKARRFEARPQHSTCARCDVRRICPHAAAR